MATDAPVGFIGLGMMGQPMARCLLRAGRSLIACDTAAAAREAVPDARFVAQPAEVAAAASVIVLMLPDSPAVAAVIEGEGGLLPTLRPGQLVIDMGSSLPQETRRLAALLTERGAQYVDAPVSGSVLRATDGTLTIMIGAEDAAYAQAEPVLGAMGRTLIRTGAVGSGHAMKALNNYVYAAGLLAVAEAARMGEALGLDLSVLAQVMNAASGRNMATELQLEKQILSGRYAGGFMLGLMRKDLETAGAIAAETGFDARQLELCRAVWAEAMAALGPRADNTEIHRFLGGIA